MSSRKSKRILQKETTTKELEYVGVGGRKNRTLTFIDQPTQITLSDGTVKYVWKGIEKLWEESVNGWGIQATKDLRRSFCFPYGGYGPLNDAEYDALAKAGKTSAHYIAMYLYERAGSYNERRKCNGKGYEEPYIYINANPDEAAKRGFPMDCWIGAYVNSANSLDKNDFNCELEVVGTEYADVRGYPHCDYFLMVVLTKDVPAKTFLRLKYGFDKSTATKRMGSMKPKAPSGKRKVAKLSKTLTNDEIQFDLAESQASSSLSSSSSSSSSSSENALVVAAASLVELSGDGKKQPTLRAVQYRLQSTLDYILLRRKDVQCMSSSTFPLLNRNGKLCKPELLETITKEAIQTMVETLLETETDLNMILG